MVGLNIRAKFSTGGTKYKMWFEAIIIKLYMNENALIMYKTIPEWEKQRDIKENEKISEEEQQFLKSFEDVKKKAQSKLNKIEIIPFGSFDVYYIDKEEEEEKEWGKQTDKQIEEGWKAYEEFIISGR